jgi:hypothetical protein
VADRGRDDRETHVPLLAPVLYDLGMINPGTDVPWAFVQLMLFAAPIIGIIGVLVGAAWIIRDARRTGDEPTDWRYRDD